MKHNKETKKHLDNVENARIYFEEMKSGLENKYDEKSEKWQESEKGEQMQEDISNLEELVSKLEDVESDISDHFEED